MAQRDKVELELPVAAEGTHEPEKTDLLDHFIVLIKWKFMIFGMVAAAMIVSAVIAYTTPNRYKAVTKLMPPQQGQSMTAAMLSQLGPLAALAGGVSVKSPSDIYITMLRSRTVVDSMIDRFSLMNIYHTPMRGAAESHLTNVTEVSAGKEGVIVISVEDPDPQRAADLANGYVDQLTKLTKDLAVTEASRRRKFFEQQMDDASQQLADAEVAMKQLQEKIGMVMFDSQSRGVIQTLALLKAQVSAKEVELRAMESYATPENPDLVRIKKELDALRSQVAQMEGHSEFSNDLPAAKLPAASMEYLRKYRDLKYHEALYELLAKQFEAARIDEGRDAVLMQQLDKAVPPETKSGPHRLTNILVTMIAAFLFAVLVAFGREALERAREDPHFQTRIQLMRFYLFGRRRS